MDSQSDKKKELQAVIDVVMREFAAGNKKPRELRSVEWAICRNHIDIDELQELSCGLIISVETLNFSDDAAAEWAAVDISEVTNEDRIAWARRCLELAAADSWNSSLVMALDIQASSQATAKIGCLICGSGQEGIDATCLGVFSDEHQIIEAISSSDEYCFIGEFLDDDILLIWEKLNAQGAGRDNDTCAAPKDNINSEIIFNALPNEEGFWYFHTGQFACCASASYSKTLNCWFLEIYFTPHFQKEKNTKNKFESLFLLNDYLVEFFQVPLRATFFEELPENE